MVEAMYFAAGLIVGMFGLLGIVYLMSTLTEMNEKRELRAETSERNEKKIEEMSKKLWDLEVELHGLTVAVKKLKEEKET